tara:strand:+ start:258 stop:563 length:306 start_codon:yes stop_codon:yes gene_type:complete
MKVIRNIKTGEFWSNEHGWGSFDGCDEYEDSWVKRLNLPIDGKWMQKPSRQRVALEMAVKAIREYQDNESEREDRFIEYWEDGDWDFIERALTEVILKEGE